ncbi:uncharacterized protein LOC110849832 [Folsomia candida]|uniref:uncharacterized protein LOC110849832 n=1 Tax=Folsomia candida TaxID=158441 RepID=UPI000B8FCD49|nr:uncharacterized protein LOC110849832 [Folsomia candida]XP_035707764.1 uncharacterized protein LOC110849832 [Folsomia candida]XP_035707765.1 uncharacterized protein LOC110849832 [Folsomia candida]XP_035707766.1 uncharacterized protein LOC110849832 [Folsomia candida]
MSSSSLIERFYNHPSNIISRGQPSKDERSRLRLSWMIKSRKGWETDFNDSSVVSKWFQDAKDELGGAVASSSGHKKVALVQLEKNWPVVIDRLPHFLTLWDGQLTPGPLDGSWVADGLVDIALTERLVGGAGKVEEIAIKANNWQPATENRVINVIDPYSYCAVAKRSHILKGGFVPKEPKNLDDYRHLLHFHSANTRNYLHRFDVKRLISIIPNDMISPPPKIEWDPNYQLLPADVVIDSDGASHFTSYVNGLYPAEHGELYATLEQVLDKMVPMFEKVLTEIRTAGQAEAESGPKTRRQLANPSIVSIAPVSLRGRKIQVVVRMATTILTPENSKHPGGQWHIEGMANEQIVAVGLHYFSNENITTSELYLGLTQRALNGVIRVVDGGNNDFGIETVPGRSVVFKNSVSHRVAPFELDDPDKPGHRKILGFFLVDPGAQILSSARVPCQQWTRYLGQVKAVLAHLLPPEIVELVVSFLRRGDQYLDTEEAKRLQGEMRDERKKRLAGTYRTRKQELELKKLIARRKLAYYGN